MTVSKALLKSREITITYGLTARRLVMEWRRVINAAAGEPVGLKVYWSPKHRDGGGVRIDG